MARITTLASARARKAAGKPAARKTSPRKRPSTIPDRNQPALVTLDLEQLNHEKAALKVKMRKVGSQLSMLRKEAGDLNHAYEELDKQMLRQDERYRQLELEDAAKNDEEAD
jgi:hypothetical protein